jgi:hypothetical protein
MFLVESVGEVDKKTCDMNKNLTINLSNVEIVHSQFGGHPLKKMNYIL